MMTLTPGRSFPDSIRQRECGLPLSTNDTRSLRNARRSTYTVDGSGLDAPCRHIATFTRQPKLVDTALGLSPSAEKSFEKLVVSVIRGRSSATTTHVRTQPRFTPRCFNWLTDDPRPFVHNSITP
jgi:hypothetical protein